MFIIQIQFPEGAVQRPSDLSVNDEGICSYLNISSYSWVIVGCLILFPIFQNIICPTTLELRPAFGSGPK